MANNLRRITATDRVPSAVRKKKTEKPAKSDRPVAPNWFRLGYLIHDVSRMRRRVFDKHMKPEGITRSQWWVLANLSRHGTDGIMNTELAELLELGKVTLGGLIDRLEVAGYVYRRIDKQDRRAKQIFITDAGYALITRMKAITEKLNEQICVNLTQEQIQAMEQNLTCMKDTLREMLVGEEISDEEEEE